MPGLGDETGPVSWQATLWNALKGVPGALGPASAEAYVLPMDAPSRLAVETMRSGQMPPGQAGPLLDIPPAKRAMYKQILAAAHARPETVQVAMPETWRAPESSVGAYWGAEIPGMPPQIDVRPLDYTPPPSPVAPVQLGVRGRMPDGAPLSPAAQPVQETLAHELLHFVPDMEVQDAFKRAPAQGAAFLDLTRAQRAPTERVQTAFGGEAPQHDMLKYLFGRAHMPMLYGSQEQQTGLGPSSALLTPERIPLYAAYLKKIFPPGPVRDQVLSGLGMR